MSTPANPQHLLRRPKKPQHKTFSWRIPAIAAIVVVVTGGGIAGFTAYGHGKRDAAPPAPAPTSQPASLSLAQNYAPPIVAPAQTNHKSHKPSTTPGASPAPNATQTPGPTPTPLSTSTPSTAQTQTVPSATAKHEAALARLAAARRAAQVLTSSGISSQPQTSVATTQNVSAPAPVPVSTQPPVQATATPDAGPTPVYAPTIVVDARFADRVEPVYPDIAKEQGVGGTAIVLATIGPDGRVLTVSIDQSTGNRQLDSSAVAAAHASRFEPPEIDGKPATETYRIVYTFDPSS